LKVAIITDKPYLNCETFIKAQIDNLDVDVVHIWQMHGRFESIGLPAPERLDDKLKRLILNKIDNEAKIIRFLRQHQIDSILAQYGMMGVAFLPIAKKMNIPIAVHFHGHDAVRESVIREYKEKYLKLFRYNKSLLLSVSHVMTQKLIGLGCEPSKIIYNPYGSDPSFFDSKPLFKKKQFVALGRFVDKKAPFLTILSFYRAWLKDSEIRLVFGGAGYLLDPCKDLVKALKLEEVVSFPEILDRKTFQETLVHSCGFIQHSITAGDGDMEGTPVAILEAGAAGLPVISTYHAGIPDVVVNGKTGLLSEPHDLESMASHILSVASNLDEAKKMGVAAIDRISKDFSMERYLKKIKFELYRLKDY